MDNQDVFDLFDKNVPYELRLRDAIINDLVVPFHYYGIRDELVNYGLTKSEERRMVAQLATTEHGDFIAREIENHRPKGKLKALAFCRNVTHARMMSEMMSEHYKTAYLTGRNDIGERIRAYNDLQSDEKELEILFTVDILNDITLLKLIQINGFAPTYNHCGTYISYLKGHKVLFFCFIRRTETVCYNTV